MSTLGWRPTLAARRLWRGVMRPIFRAMLHLVDAAYPWESYGQIAVRPHALGAGSIHPFEWYFTGTTQVTIQTVREVCSWLMSCEYNSDLREFGRMDYWQHPVEFEVRRRGDCDDHALWAWRKLIELGRNAEFFSGTKRGMDGSTWIPHAWVTFQNSHGRWFLLETTHKQWRGMVSALAEVRDTYRPHFSANRDFVVTCYGGYVLHLRARESAASLRPIGRAQR